MLFALFFHNGFNYYQRVLENIRQVILTLRYYTAGLIRIPHAGWPERASVSNLVFRITLDNNVTIMHMGDADSNDEHFQPYKDYWQKTKEEYW